MVFHDGIAFIFTSKVKRHIAVLQHIDLQWFIKMVISLKNAFQMQKVK
jgi:hypothetical protein